MAIQTIYVDSLEEASAIADLMQSLAQSEANAGVYRDDKVSVLTRHLRGVGQTGSRVQATLQGRKWIHPRHPLVQGVALSANGWNHDMSLVYSAAVVGPQSKLNSSGEVVETQAGGSANLNLGQAGCLAFIVKPVLGVARRVRVILRGAVRFYTAPVWQTTLGGLINPNVGGSRQYTAAFLPSNTTSKGDWVGLGAAVRDRAISASCIETDAVTAASMRAPSARDNAYFAVCSSAFTSTGASYAQRAPALANIHTVAGAAGWKSSDRVAQEIVTRASIENGIAQYRRAGYSRAEALYNLWLRNPPNLSAYKWFVTEWEGYYWYYQPTMNNFMEGKWDNYRYALWCPLSISAYVPTTNAVRACPPTVTRVDVIDDETIELVLDFSRSGSGYLTQNFLRCTLSWTDAVPAEVRITSSGCWTQGCVISGLPGSLTAAESDAIPGGLDQLDSGGLAYGDII